METSAESSVVAGVPDDDGDDSGKSSVDARLATSADAAEATDSAGSFSAEGSSLGYGNEFGKCALERTSLDAISAMQDPALSESGPSGKPKRTIIARQTALHNPILVEATRRIKLGLQEGEATAYLKFSVPKGQALDLPPAPEGSAESARVTLCRRFEDLHLSRREDDAAYLDAVEKGAAVTLVAARPTDGADGGWRCHARHLAPGADPKSDAKVECRHVNPAPARPGSNSVPGKAVRCAKCSRPKPALRPGFAFLRLATPGVRRQRREYLRIIAECDAELGRCDAASREATARIAACESGSSAEEEARGSDGAPSPGGAATCEDSDEEALMMDLNLVQKGAWQRVNARALLPMLAERKLALHRRLATARTELSIVVQAAFGLAVPHVQRVLRRYLVRKRLDAIRTSVLDFARFSAAVSSWNAATSFLIVSLCQFSLFGRYRCLGRNTAHRALPPGSQGESQPAPASGSIHGDQASVHSPPELCDGRVASTQGGVPETTAAPVGDCDSDLVSRAFLQGKSATAPRGEETTAGSRREGESGSTQKGFRRNHPKALPKGFVQRKMLKPEDRVGPASTRELTSSQVTVDTILGV